MASPGDLMYPGRMRLKPAAAWLAPRALSRMSVTELETAEAQAAAAGGDEKRAYVQRIFSQIAPRYDLLNHLLSFNIDKAWRRKAIARLGWEHAPTGVYVDLCAGTLDVAAELSKCPGFAGRVIGADFANPCCAPAPARRRRRWCRRSSRMPPICRSRTRRPERSWRSASETSPIDRGLRGCIACWSRARCHS